MDFTMASTARAIFGNSRCTATGTVRSSRLIRRRISSADLRSSPREFGFRCSVFRFAKGLRLSQTINYSGRRRRDDGQEETEKWIVPRELSGARWSTRQSQGLENGVVQRGSNLPDFLVGARGVHAIGEQNHEEIAFRINPNGSARKPRMAEALLGVKMARGRWLRRDVPSNRPCRVTNYFTRCEGLNRRAREQPAMRVNSAIQQHLREFCDVPSGG